MNADAFALRPHPPRRPLRTRAACRAGRIPECRVVAFDPDDPAVTV